MFRTVKERSFKHKEYTRTQTVNGNVTRKAQIIFISTQTELL